MTLLSSDKDLHDRWLESQRSIAKELASKVKSHGLGFVKCSFPVNMIKTAPPWVFEKSYAGVQAGMGFGLGKDVTGSQVSKCSVYGTYGIDRDALSTGSSSLEMGRSPYGRYLLTIEPLIPPVTKLRSSASISSGISGSLNTIFGKHDWENWTLFSYIAPSNRDPNNRPGNYVQMVIAAPPDLLPAVAKTIEISANPIEFLFQEVFPGVIGPNDGFHIARFKAGTLLIRDPENRIFPKDIAPKGEIRKSFDPMVGELPLNVVDRNSLPKLP